jgi:hypothetical protein
MESLTASWPPQNPAELPRLVRSVGARGVPDAHIIQQNIPRLTREAHHPRQDPGLRRRRRAMKAPGAAGRAAGGAAAVNPGRRHVPRPVGAGHQAGRAHLVGGVAHQNRCAEHKREQWDAVALREGRRRLRSVVEAWLAYLRRDALRSNSKPFRFPTTGASLQLSW